MHVSPSPLLRWSLRADALASVATGLATTAGAVSLAPLLAIPQAYLVAAGLFSLGYGLLAGVLSTRQALARRLVGAIVVGNLAWAAHCVLLAFVAGWAPSVAGMVFLLGQAAVVGALAEAQWFGLRRSPSLPRDAGAALAAHA